MDRLDKVALRNLILAQLKADRDLLLQAASAAHAAATHAENIPDSKYETLSIEASYIAQGQANRAQEISLAMESFRQLDPKNFTPHDPIRLGALVLLEDEDGHQRLILLGPAAGGLKLSFPQGEIMVITPDSPLGENLLGRQVGDVVELAVAGRLREYEILTIS
ncbi:GreA/GreB family elongation factor [Geopsychrobacter electrodiphilus]|uniref:GreA/GreB family elongation factor n=1 Tax=Geopsychrobacter electrodiphilus TaxID=225196 RepID=UPI0005266C24|nr:GreA/GreB family elongation factor [Geopsychrobacter electrodiphilus]